MIERAISLQESIVSLAGELNLRAFVKYADYVKEGSSTEEVLHELLKAQYNINFEKKYNYRIKQAAFPVIKTLDTFVFDTNRCPDLNKDMVMQLATCKFVKNKRNVIAVGSSGTGKTHLMTALCVEAITKGYSVKFRRASDLVNQMKEADNEKALTKYIKKINACDILLIDELGFLNIDVKGANLLYQIFAERYEVKSTIVTSNYEFSQWKSFLGTNSVLVSALIGRLIDDSTVLNMNGENFRLARTMARMDVKV